MRMIVTALSGIALIAGAASDKGPEPPERIVVRAYTWTGDELDVLGPAEWTVTTRYGKLEIPLHELRTVDLAFRGTDWQTGQLQSWIRDLGHPRYPRRQQAETALRTVGPAAKQALERAVVEADEETKIRIGRLIKSLDTESSPRTRDRITTENLVLVGRVEQIVLRIRSGDEERPVPLDHVARLRVEIPLREGTVATNDSWKGDRRKTDGWEQPGFDDSNWPPAVPQPPEVTEGRPGSDVAVWVKESPGEIVTPGYLRKSFELSPAARHGVLFVSADDDYVVYLNGKLVIKNLDGKATEQRMDRYAVSRHLIAGRNVVAIEAIDTAPIHRFIALKLIVAPDKPRLEALEHKTEIGRPGFFPFQRRIIIR